MAEAKRVKQFVRNYDYDHGNAGIALADGTVLGNVALSDIHSDVVAAFTLQKAVAHIANAYTNAVKNGKDAAKRVAVAIAELTDGDVSFRDGSGGESSKGTLYDVAEVLCELGFSNITFPDKSKQEFSDVDSCYATLKALWNAPAAVEGGPAGKGIYARIRNHPKVAAKLAEGKAVEEEVLG
jgi:hypothetical protein